MRKIAMAAVLLALPAAIVAQETGIVLGAYIPRGGDSFTNRINNFNNAVGKNHAIILQHRWWEGVIADQTLLDQVDDAGATLMIGWYSQHPSPPSPDPNYSYDNIINGNYDDSIIRPSARFLRDYGNPVLISFDPEMNLSDNDYHAGNYYNQSGTHTGTQGFIEMWQHVHGIFQTEGATNVQWVWSPNYASGEPDPYGDYVNYYPGSAYVDWVGVHGYNFNGTTSWGDPMSAADLFGAILTDFSNRYPKPQMLSTFGCAKGTRPKTDWITTAFGTTFRNYANLHACVWWNAISGGVSDFRVVTNPGDASAVEEAVTAAYRSAIAGGHYLDYLPDPGDFEPGPVQPSGLSLEANPNPVPRGGTVSLNWTITGLNQRCDGYLGAQLPDGTLLVADPSLRFGPAIQPVAGNFMASGTIGGTLNLNIPEGIDPGSYRLQAALTRAGGGVGSFLSPGIVTVDLVVN